MSRIYDNTPLQAVPVHAHNIERVWDTTKYQGGNGVLLEGHIVGRSRHLITDTTQKKWRYFVLHTKVDRAHKRVFNAAGQEVEPNFSETGLVSTGFLNSSYKSSAKGVTDRVEQSEVGALVNQHEELNKLTEIVHMPQCVDLWLEEKGCIELVEGDAIRVKTTGDCPFVASIAKLESASVTVQNYAGGDPIGMAWTDKVMAVKKDMEERTGGDGQGADDDEWDD